MAAAVAQPQPAQFDVVLGGYGDFKMALVAAFAPTEFGPCVGEDGFVLFDRYAGRLQRCGPEFAAVHITQVTEVAPVVASAILAPARDGHLALAAVTATGAGQQAVVTAVGKQLHRRA
ncbi:hypothetical protein D3C81_1388800 [compost metagenome]